MTLQEAEALSAPWSRAPSLSCPAVPAQGFAERYAAPAARPGVMAVRLAGGLPAWAVTGHAAAQAMLTDPRLVNDMTVVNALSASTPHGLPRTRYPESFLSTEPQLLARDGAEHRRMRRIVSPYFQAAQAGLVEAELESCTEDLVDALARRPQGDLVADLAIPLAAAGVASMFDITPGRATAVVRATMAAGLAGHPDAPHGRATGQAFVLRVLQIVATARRKRQDNAARALLTAHGDGRLTGPQTAAMVGLLLVGMVESLTTVIPTAALIAMQRPEVRAALRSGDAVRVDAVVEELLRLSTPFHHSAWRMAREPLVLDGTPIRAGDVVVASFLHTNLDERRWPRPTEVRLDRPTPRGHLSFGHGAHYCLGAARGRAQTRIALTRLFTRLPLLTPAADPAGLYWHGGGLRHLHSLPVHTTGGPAGPVGAVGPVGPVGSGDAG
ncbi:cytochrome P450 [Embleya sp. NBC_00888]|uniref:cytochrome P450 n=1 Tax=Embleya sp. NBC_00888 TaxID=2975960 RepID=UPI003865DF6E|nr:cytochrome P450 [Embleya sp. NBC_00888]